jgi:hypothetical protein
LYVHSIFISHATLRQMLDPLQMSFNATSRLKPKDWRAGYIYTIQYPPNPTDELNPNS